MTAPDLELLRTAGAVLVERDRVRIDVAGEDRFTWLNGMVTCDLKAIVADEGRAPRAAYGCVLNVKGRVLADVVVVAGGGALGAWIPRDSAESVLELWNRYIIMEDCTVERDETRALLAIQGGDPAALVAATGIDGAAALDLLGLTDGVVVELPRDAIDEPLRRCVAAGAHALDEAAARAVKVETARATWGVDVDAHHYVQEAGLGDRAVSFQKGCYVGQEVVCMLQMRGKVHRRLVQLSVAHAAAATAGAEVKLGDDVVGTVTSAVAHADGTARALALVKSSAAAGCAVEVGGARAEIVTDAR